MKKIVGASLLSTMLLLGQPIMAFADIDTTTTTTDGTTATTDSKTINFGDIGSIIAEQNIEAHINVNKRLQSKLSSTDLKKTIRELEDDLEDVNDQRDSADFAEIIQLGAEKRVLLANIKLAERNIIDQPTLEAMADLQASMSDDSQTRFAESIFVAYNQLNLNSADISLSIKTLEDQLTTLQLQESLGMITYNAMNDLKTKIVDLQTNLESIEFQRESLESQLKNVLNDQENTLVIGSIPIVDQELIIEDEDADLKMAQENSYAIKLQEQQIVILQSALASAQKDHGGSSKEYKSTNYELENATLELAQLKDTLRLNYNSMLDDITKKQSDLRLAEQTLADKKVALTEAQIRMSLGMLSKLDMDSAFTNYQVQEDAVKTKQIELFNAKNSYEWFLKGMPQA
ncbi:TolC family protein [Desulfosporosinus fructosivorans]|uniref:TolC family protein n=1 Tax=Desulfosporosinus fructosivorans TaxID=2018669 RepID=A0A4Z0RBN7_9FIRM|nr:TolC family protein [Desulfosporosinus fructosivorans]TGE39577.1 TolC family protein [Desulfosporosinus fructosivorans]